MPHHLQQPIGQRQQQRKKEKRTVKRVHEEKPHSKWRRNRLMFSSLPRDQRRTPRITPAVSWLKVRAASFQFQAG
jgi:hypothetical protein